MNARTQALSDAGVSIWLDDLSRERLETDDLKNLIAERSVVGVTTNPTIFAAALANGERYVTDLVELRGGTVDAAIEALTTADVAKACDVFRDIYEATEGRDGRVSIEVSPLLADDAEHTIAEAIRLWERVERPNAMIKIPATDAGLEAIAAVTALGISVNVTLIFSLERYRDVINAYLVGLDRARAAGRDLSQIHSVASFFVSRVDTAIDAELERIGGDALDLRGQAGLANARLAYRIYTEQFDTEWAKDLLASGANPQRPLWASTGVKNPEYPDTLYVTGLVAPDVVNTMPAATLEALADHGEVIGDTITGQYGEAERVLDAIAEAGVSYREVTRRLEVEAVEKFVASWHELTETVQHQLDA